LPKSAVGWRSFGLLQMQEADAGADARVQTRRIDLRGFVKVARRLAPLSGALEANGRVEMAAGMIRIQPQQLLIALRSLGEHAKFVLNQRLRRVQFARRLTGRQRLMQHIERFFALPLQMQRNRFRQRTRTRFALPVSVSVFFHLFQLPLALLIP
jgi:hypothetical protein